jgi:colanic acid/amylovoran biosynthesis glycosyltransferase
MTRIAYLLHNFPGKTDTFIKREIRSLQKRGADVSVISVWRPSERETTSEIMAEWKSDTQFLLPQSVARVLFTTIKVFFRNPLVFVRTLLFSVATARPGVRGALYQLFYFAEALLASEALRAGKISHIHNHIGDQSGTVTMLAGMLTGIGYSVTFHGWPVFFDAKDSRIKEKVQRAEFVRAISYFCRSQLMMFSDSDDPRPFKVVHCGLEIDKYTFRLPSPAVRTIFCAARLSPEKGLTFLLQAVAQLIARGHDLRLRLAGSGPSHERLAALASDLSIQNRVEFLGFLDEDRIIEELQNSDLFVLPSFVEGVPVSAMEAMAIGVPVIATNIAGTSELVENGSTGTLVRPADVDELVATIEAVINDYEFRLRSAELARKKVVTEFDVDVETATLHSCLIEVSSNLPFSG